ncbi:hypothetical protein [Brevibacillus porteri]|uniref:Uncharacterized protein n=1 Tax=Brevibacillus porteri TaxID=2126350 RepID=A0ABX5FWB2_9BACL|nr:hypothetical protein [Brevibacillus porteri]MED1798885.1 hypothetical protein [Brevibacillus porteri]MED2130207.1 hypothetical protein [Brevibacillus porteri]MED2746435.1 hypothetical protein [Brevibacillus porteri]MED2814726.1 hypothetical protein [Brevibacillus porteri]MED2894437.1 hypothetical protein [Brevibacillus porteri]
MRQSDEIVKVFRPVQTDGESSHLCRAFLNGRGRPADILDYEVNPYMQKLFIMACQAIEAEEEEKVSI